MPDHDMTFSQAPIMTAAHVEAMRLIDGHYPFADTLFPRYLIGEIYTFVLAHVQSMLEIQQVVGLPVPSRELTPYEVMTHASNYTPPANRFTDWLKEYSHLSDEECQSDQ